MDCPKNTYQNLADIVESYANDQQFWSGKYLIYYKLRVDCDNADLTDQYLTLSSNDNNVKVVFMKGSVVGWLGCFSI